MRISDWSSDVCSSDLKGTVYSNASSKFSSTFADFKAGKADENELLTAAKNFQDASRALFGSGANFFADFDSIKAMLTGAKGSVGTDADLPARSEEHTSELQSLMRISYAVFCLKKTKTEQPYL